MDDRATFKQRIVVAKPPVWDRCVQVFGRAAVDRYGVIFSYGDAIYNPSNASISRPLQAHESVHGHRQTSMEGGIDAWWEQYFTDKAFRLHEEVLAHHAEYRACLRRHGQRPADLRTIAGRLSGNLYGGIIRPEQATHAVLTGALP